MKRNASIVSPNLAQALPRTPTSLPRHPYTLSRLPHAPLAWTHPPAQEASRDPPPSPYPTNILALASLCSLERPSLAGLGAKVRVM